MLAIFLPCACLLTQPRSPTRARACPDSSQVEGLAPVWLLSDGTPHWHSHTEFFRWFATGDITLLTFLLVTKLLH